MIGGNTDSYQYVSFSFYTNADHIKSISSLIPIFMVIDGLFEVLHIQLYVDKYSYMMIMIIYNIHNTSISGPGAKTLHTHLPQQCTIDFHRVNYTKQLIHIFHITLFLKTSHNRLGALVQILAFYKREAGKKKGVLLWVSNVSLSHSCSLALQIAASRWAVLVRSRDVI